MYVNNIFENINILSLITPNNQHTTLPLNSHTMERVKELQLPFMRCTVSKNVFSVFTFYNFHRPLTLIIIEKELNFILVLK